MKPVIGLTGGIASGKSTVGKILSGIGVAVIDADQLSREVAVKGGEGLEAIVSEFGESVLTPEGELDRRGLAATVFQCPISLQKLNAIMHPRIAALSAERIREAKATDTPYVIYDAALLVELGTYKTVDKLIVVAADPELQVQRVMCRNNLSEAEARSRLASQCSVAEKIAVADYVIQNDNNRDALRERAIRVHEQILQWIEAENLTGL